MCSSTLAASAEAAQPAQREQVQALEEELNRARADNAAAQQKLRTMETRLREVEAARRSPPLVYGLATLVVLLLVTIGVLIRRLLHLRTDLLVDQAVATGPHSANGVLALKESPLDHTWVQMRVMTEPVASNPIPLESAQAPITTLPATRPAARELSVDELLDLDQQADFLVALGQDEAAIDLLMAQLRSSGGASALPYLKLLDIYRRRTDLDAHERIRQRFSRRFNAHAPVIAADPAAGQRLEDYPAAIAQLQLAWASPGQATTLLESLMVRSDSGDPSFDLPAFSDLMLLHAIARDLREREVGEGGLDLLLPLADETSVISASAPPPATLDLQLP
jgi:hypothetical protein